MQIEADSFQIRTGSLFPDFVDTRRGETQFLKVYANHTRLTPPQRASHLVMFKISIHLCRSRSEKLNRSLNGRKSNPLLNYRIPNYIFYGQNPTDVFSKSSNFQDHLFWA